MRDLTIQRAYDEILYSYLQVDYDHRKFMPPGLEVHPEYEEHMSEKFRQEYACFKYAVASVLEPDTILEVGVRGGVSALAFLHARKQAMYVGIDNEVDSGEWGIDFCGNAVRWFRELNFKAEILNEDSQKLKTFSGRSDLVHIDGDHSFEAVRHDTVAAWNGGAKWILFDDAKDTAVVAGVFHALKFDLDRGSADWTYFPTWTGNILLKTGIKGWSK